MIASLRKHRRPPEHPPGGGAEPDAARASLEAFIRGRGPADAEVDEVVSLRPEESDGMKAMGYGAPVRVRFRTEGRSVDWVFRTQNLDTFGHEREADRWANLVMARDDFARMPRHVRPRALGVLTPDGERIALPPGMPFLVTDYVPGRPYAKDLEGLADRDGASADALAKAEALARYLVETHAEHGTAAQYRRSIRDLVGDGEGIFGLVESYPEHDPVAPRVRLQALEAQAVRWRWRLFDRADRCRRTHGDFHPFNLLFDDDRQLHVLDCSRGAAGEPADDLCALSINYLFFGLRSHGALRGAYHAVWDRFWSTYLDTTHDTDALELVAPFFAWRALVLASPSWYPDETDRTRDTLLRFAERLLDGARFDPRRIGEVLS